jgi:hypothetical protein
MTRRFQFLADEQQLKYGFGNHSGTTTTSRVLWDARRVHEHEQSPIVELVQRFQNLISPVSSRFQDDESGPEEITDSKTPQNLVLTGREKLL